ncbi:hypothetical protein HZB60_10395 [candidate division KSB1 bacterium]|nr:hypothetical protein [candidate division KSB1 bacterium]
MKPEPVFTDYLAIVDESGQPRITLDASRGHPTIGLRNQTGAGILIGLDEVSSQPYVSASDKQGRVRLSFSVENDSDSAELLVDGTVTPTATADSMSTRHISVRDSAENPRIVLESEPQPCISLLNSNGAGVIVGFEGVDSQPSIGVVDKRGNSRFMLSFSQEDESISMSLLGTGKRGAVHFTTSDASGQPAIMISSPKGNMGVMIRSDKAGFQIVLCDSDGHPRASIGVHETGVRAATYDLNGKATWASDRDCQPTDA